MSTNDRKIFDFQDYQEKIEKKEEKQKIKFNIELDNFQNSLIEKIISKIKEIGDTEENEDRKNKNKENYIELIELLMTVKQEFLKENMYMFMTSGFNPETEIPFYNPDTKSITKVTLKDVEFNFGEALEEEIPEEEMNSLVSFIQEEQKLIEETKELKIKEKRKLPTVEDIKKLRTG